MLTKTEQTCVINRRVRAILLTGNNSVLFIKRVKPSNCPPYWIAPGGGVENNDSDLFATLERELIEELGAVATVLETAFVLKHWKAGKQLEEHFYICRLEDYDLNKRDGPEFDDPLRGEFIPDEIALDERALNSINIKTREMRDWMIANLDYLQEIP